MARTEERLSQETAPHVIPALELKGSAAERLRTLEGAIVRLQQLRIVLGGDSVAPVAPSELRGRYINAPVWPWFAAGWIIGALFVALLMVAWTYS
jgi:hypothetical protein